MKLRKDQKEAMESILSSLKDNRMVLFQAPTGWGKTVLIADLAVKLIEQGKNVIIVTLRNDLAAQTIATIKRYAEDYTPVAVVGKTNYIMIKRAIAELVKIKKNVKKDKEQEYDEVMTILNDAKEPYLFISDIEHKNKDIAENEFWVLLKYLALPQNDDKIPKISDGYNFVVTNMFYLAHYLIKRDDDIMPNTVILLDEADYFADNIRRFFNTNCSFHTIKVISDYLYLTKGNKIFEKLSKKAEKIRNKGNDIFKLAKVGTQSDIDATYDTIINNIDLKFIDKILTKKYLDPNNYIDKSLIRNLAEVKNFIKRVGQKKDFKGEYKISFSSIRQYVSIERTTKVREALGYLSKLWRIFTDASYDRSVVVFGATIASPTKFSNEAELKKDIRENKLFLPINISFDYLSSETGKKNAVAYLLDKTLTDCHYHYGNRFATKKWIKTIVDVVKTTYKTDSNGLIMCKSRETAKEIAEAIEIENLGFQIYYDKNTDIKTPLNGFKSSSSGGIFVSHSGLSVGMDVPNISQVYIAQIPYTPPGPGQDTKERDFIQWIGRLRDDKKETRGLYIIDSRIWDEVNLLKKIKTDYLSVEIINLPKPKEVT